MAKKSFKDNPALQFITAPAADDTAYTHNTEPKQATQEKKPRPRAIGAQERKTKRLNLLLQPSTMNDLTKIAYMKQTSVNDLINTLLRGYTESEAETISRYDSIFPGKEL